MSPEIVILAAIAALLISRSVARRWIRERWLDDTLSNRQAGVLFWLVAAGPLLLVAVIAFISSPAGGLLLAAILVFVLLPMTTLFVALVDYAGTRELKERLRHTGPDSHS